jgi:hypothetical protein
VIVAVHPDIEHLSWSKLHGLIEVNVAVKVHTTLTHVVPRRYRKVTQDELVTVDLKLQVVLHRREQRLVVACVLLYVLIVVAQYKHYVLANDTVAKLWDALVATEREVSKVYQDVVLSHSTVYVVDYGRVHLFQTIKVPSPVQVTGPRSDSSTDVLVVYVRVGGEEHVLTFF